MTSVDNKIKVLRFVHTEIVSHLAQRQFFFRKKPCQTKGIDYRKAKLLHNKHKYMAHKQWKFQGAAPSMKDVIKMLRGVNLSGAHCILIIQQCTVAECVHTWKLENKQTNIFTVGCFYLNQNNNTISSYHNPCWGHSSLGKSWHSALRNFRADLGRASGLGIIKSGLQGRGRRKQRRPAAEHWA